MPTNPKPENLKRPAPPRYSYRQPNVVVDTSVIMASGILHINEPFEADIKAFKLRKYKDLKKELAELEEVLRDEGLLDDLEVEKEGFELRGSL